MDAVAQLYRYPVKSLQGQPVESLTFAGGYAVGDRKFGIVDPAAGKVLSGKRWPALLQGSARLEAEDVVLTLPDGAEIAASDPKVHDALSAWLDHEVRLEPPGADASSPMEMGADPLDDESETFDWPPPPGAWVDLAQAHWLTTASLAAAAALAPDSTWDVRRFRPTALLEVAGEGFVEDGWAGVDVGEVGSDVFMPTVRCAMPTRAQPGLDRDKQVLQVLATHHQSNLGVYCSVTRDGTIRVGDPVTPRPS